MVWEVKNICFKSMMWNIPRVEKCLIWGLWQTLIKMSHFGDILIFKTFFIRTTESRQSASYKHSFVYFLSKDFLTKKGQSVKNKKMSPSSLLLNFFLILWLPWSSEFPIKEYKGRWRYTISACLDLSSNK